MDNLQRAAVSLLIDGDDLTPSEITSLLGQIPRLGVRKGESFCGSHGKTIVAKSGMWQYGGSWESPADIDIQVASLLSELSQDSAIWKDLTQHFHCYVTVGGYFNDWTGGVTLSSSTIKALHDRGLAIDFDLYAPASDQ